MPKTEMTAYKNVLPEKDRWSLVLLLRSFNARMAKGVKDKSP